MIIVTGIKSILIFKDLRNIVKRFRKRGNLYKSLNPVKTDSERIFSEDMNSRMNLYWLLTVYMPSIYTGFVDLLKVKSFIPFPFDVCRVRVTFVSLTHGPMYYHLTIQINNGSVVQTEMTKTKTQEFSRLCVKDKGRSGKSTICWNLFSESEKHKDKSSLLISFFLWTI